MRIDEADDYRTDGDPNDSGTDDDAGGPAEGRSEDVMKRT